MSKRAIIVVDLQNDYLATGKFPLVGIDTALENAARLVDASSTRLVGPAISSSISATRAQPVHHSSCRARRERR